MNNINKTKKYTNKSIGLAEKQTFRLYDEDVKIIEKLEKSTGYSKSSIIRELIRNADKIFTQF